MLMRSRAPSGRGPLPAMSVYGTAPAKGEQSWARPHFSIREEASQLGDCGYWWRCLFRDADGDLVSNYLDVSPIDRVSRVALLAFRRRSLDIERPSWARAHVLKKIILV